MNITPITSATAQPLNAPIQTVLTQRLCQRKKQPTPVSTAPKRTSFFHRLQFQAVAHLQHDRDNDSSLKGLSEHDEQSNDAENVRHAAGDRSAITNRFTQTSVQRSTLCSTDHDTQS